MAFEKPSSKSEGFGLHEEWEALPAMVIEFPILPVQILSNLLESLF